MTKSKLKRNLTLVHLVKCIGTKTTDVSKRACLSSLVHACSNNIWYDCGFCVHFLKLIVWNYVSRSSFCFMLHFFSFFTFAIYNLFCLYFVFFKLVYIHSSCTGSNANVVCLCSFLLHLFSSGLTHYQRRGIC